jgi:lipoprotein-anchoring transpeptidase ErfK/SrfK
MIAAFQAAHTYPLRMSQLVIPPAVRLALLSALALLASCQSSSSRGQTQYLEAFSTTSVPHSALYNADQDSYWDGDGMSGAPSITIDISDQKAYFYKGGALAGVSALSTGDERHATKTGNFKVFEKDQWHKSNLYGDFVDSAGNVVQANVDVTKDKAPPGTRFEGSKMHHFMRFVGGIGMHEGFLPGYAASHGCVRMPPHMAAIFYHNVTKGTPVTVRP